MALWQERIGLTKFDSNSVKSSKRYFKLKGDRGRNTVRDSEPYCGLLLSSASSAGREDAASSMTVLLLQRSVSALLTILFAVG